MRPINTTLLNIIISFSFISTISLSQESGYSISGKIVDASNNNPVEFANVGIEGTYMGTASDIDGVFNLAINEKYSDFDVVISAVGYQAKKIKVKELAGDVVLTVNLTPVKYGLSQVDVKAESMVLYGILKSAGNLVCQNYISEPFEYSIFYQSEKKTGDRKTEATMFVVDATGYGDRTYTDAFVNRSYYIDEIRRNYEYKPIDEGVCNIDFLLLFDIVRVRGNVLDSAGLYSFSLKLEDVSTFNGDSVWAIGYKNSKPDFSTTGNRNVTSYSGVIYISKSTNAVLRNELSVRTNGHFSYGYTAFYNDEIKSKSITKVEYKVVTTYRKGDSGKYALSSVYAEKVIIDNSGNELVFDENMKVLKIEKGNSFSEKRREYYSDKSVDKEFWERFTIPQFD